MYLIHGRAVSNFPLLSHLSLLLCLFFLNHPPTVPSCGVCFCLCTPLWLWTCREINGLSCKGMARVHQDLKGFHFQTKYDGGIEWWPRKLESSLFFWILPTHAHAYSVAQSCPTLRNSWTAAHQHLLSVGFSRQEDWRGLPFPPPGESSQLKD